MNVQTTNAESWRPVVQLALVFAAIKFAVEFIGNLLAQHFGYGIFRDEMYYIICGRHLAWGYADKPPWVPLKRGSRNCYSASIIWRCSAASWHSPALRRFFSL